MIRHFLNPPNWFTSASIFCSVYAISLLIAADDVTSALLVKASVLVVFGGIFDLLDGRVARLTNRFSEFGVQLDSIADIIGFGLAPAMIAWSWKLQYMGPVGVGVTFWFVLCTAFRLARFNVNTVEQTWNFDGHSQGLTSTMAGGILVTLVWVSNGYLANVLNPSPQFAAILVATLGFLMISSIPFRNFKDLRQNANAKRIFAVTLGCCLTGAAVMDVSMYWGIGAFIYITFGLADGLLVAAQHRYLGKALLIEDDEDGDSETATVG